MIPHELISVPTQVILSTDMGSAAWVASTEHCKSRSLWTSTAAKIESGSTSACVRVDWSSDATYGKMLRQSVRLQQFRSGTRPDIF